MNEQFLLVIIGVIGMAILFLGFGFLWLFREHKKLKQNYQQVAKQLQCASDDLAGLCSAAIVVDSRMAANESRLIYMMDNISTPQSKPQPNVDEEIEDDETPQGYELAIEKIRQGANAEELVKRCGLTRDEAVLLMRLHGKGRN